MAYQIEGRALTIISKQKISLEGSPSGFSIAALFIFVFALSFSLYYFTLQPGITWYNSGELVVAGMTLDVPHPPGYPLFTRLANIAFRILPGEPAWRINLLSAFLGALAAGIFSLWLYCWGGLPRLISGGAALWMISFVTFWEEATNAEVYTLEVLLLTLLLIVASWLRKNEISPHRTFFSGLILAFALGHRPTFLLLIPIFIFSLRNTELRARCKRNSLIIFFVIGLIIGFIPVYDLYFRLQNPLQCLMDPQIGQGFSGFWRVITAADFHKALGGFSALEVFSRLKHWGKLIAHDGSVPMLFLPWFALFQKKSNSHYQTHMCAWVLFVNSSFVLNYNAFEAHTMLLPSILALCGLSAHGFVGAMRERKKLCQIAFIIIVANSILISAIRLAPRDREAEQFATRLAALVPLGATLLLSNDVEFRPFWYMRLAHSFRPDIKIRLIDSVAPEVVQDIRVESLRRGVFGSLIFPKELRAALANNFQIRPLGYLNQILSEPTTKRPAPDSAPIFSIPFSNQISCGVFEEPVVISMPDENGKILPRGKGRCRDGDVILYSFSILNPTEELKDLLISVWVVDSKGNLFSQNGITLGYDIFWPFLEESTNAALPMNGSLDERRFQRAFVLPSGLPKGDYEIRVLAAVSKKHQFPGLTAKQLENVNLLNYDGFLEVFLLKFGLVGKGLISATNWEKILLNGPTWQNASNPAKLLEVSVEN